MDEKPIEKNPQGSGSAKIVGLFLAFVPSALGFAFMNSKLNENSLGALGFLCLISLTCCITSAVMLFRRGTTWSIVFGVMFLMVNVLISVYFLLFLGCASLLKS